MCFYYNILELFYSELSCLSKYNETNRMFNLKKMFLKITYHKNLMLNCFSTSNTAIPLRNSTSLLI